jgi:hypothetical protein
MLIMIFWPFVLFYYPLDYVMFYYLGINTIKKSDSFNVGLKIPFFKFTLYLVSKFVFIFIPSFSQILPKCSNKNRLWNGPVRYTSYMDMYQYTTYVDDCDWSINNI